MLKISDNTCVKDWQNFNPQTWNNLRMEETLSKWDLKYNTDLLDKVLLACPAIALGLLGGTILCAFSGNWNIFTPATLATMPVAYGGLFCATQIHELKNLFTNKIELEKYRHKFKAEIAELEK